jgi:hypothetical protein
MGGEGWIDFNVQLLVILGSIGTGCWMLETGNWKLET